MFENKQEHQAAHSRRMKLTRVTFEQCRRACICHEEKKEVETIKAEKKKKNKKI